MGCLLRPTCAPFKGRGKKEEREKEGREERGAHLLTQQLILLKDRFLEKGGERKGEGGKEKKKEEGGERRVEERLRRFAGFCVEEKKEKGKEVGERGRGDTPSCFASLTFARRKKRGGKEKEGGKGGGGSASRTAPCTKEKGKREKRKKKEKLVRAPHPPFQGLVKRVGGEGEKKKKGREGKEVEAGQQISFF